MAPFIGVTPGLVCRILYDFAYRGLFRITPTQFELLDRSRLSELSLARDSHPDD
jgi:hypothetical protein